MFIDIDSATILYIAKRMRGMCPIFNLEKFHQLKPKDELANMGIKNKFGVINQ